MTSITPVEQWAPPSDEVTLPSGKVARLRDSLPVYSLLRSGKLDPQQLAALESASTGQLEDPALAVQLVDVVCESMFIEPRVSLDGADGTVPVDHLEQDDQDFVLARAFGGTPSEAFPGEPVGDGAGENGEVLGKPTKRAARPAKRKPSSSRSRQRAS